METNFEQASRLPRQLKFYRVNIEPTKGSNQAMFKNFIIAMHCINMYVCMYIS